MITFLVVFYVCFLLAGATIASAFSPDASSPEYLTQFLVGANITTVALATGAVVVSFLFYLF